jgi:hypothetical protein
MPQQFIFTALPWKNAKTGQLMISAYVSMQLETPSNTTLQAFPDVRNWTRLMEQAKFTLFWNDDKQSKADLEVKLDRSNYELLFAPTIKVRSFQPQDLSKLTLLSFPEKHIAGFVQEVYRKVGNQKIQQMPDDNFLSNDFKDLLPITEYNPSTNFQQKRPPYNEADFVAHNPAAQNQVKRQLSQTRVMPFSPSPSPATDFAQLRLFNDTGKKKEMRGKPQDIAKPDFEFHDILAVLANHPELLRRFGLVIDLVVSDKVAKDLPATGFVRVVPEKMKFDQDTRISCPATAYVYTPTGFYAQSKPDSVIDKGLLKINGPEFSIVQIDTNGAALKLAQQMDNLMLYKAKQAFQYFDGKNLGSAGKADQKAILDHQNDTPREAGLPALRSAGIGVVRNGLAAQLHKKWAGAAAFGDRFLKNAPPSKEFKADKAVILLPATTAALYADDLVQGYRMDIQWNNKWYSLHRRLDEYVLDPGGKNIALSKDQVEDEGFIQLSVAQDTDDKTQLRIGEVMARWEGWSLSVNKPGKALSNPRPGQSEVDANTNANYLLPNDFKDFRLQVKSNLVKGTLPKLRFGSKYRVKIRTVDLAGNSVGFEQNPENAALSVSGEITYQRFENLPTPALVLGNALKDGESVERLVVRSNANSNARDFEKNNPVPNGPSGGFDPNSGRHVKAPRAAQLMAEQHGMFDQAMHSQSGQKDMYTLITSKDKPFENPADFTAVSRSFIPFNTTDKIELEYLADPMAAGVVFSLDPDSPRKNLGGNWTPGVPHFYSFYDDREYSDPATLPVIGFDLWKAPKSFRIQLVESDTAGAKVPNWNAARRILSFYLPKGEMATLRYACFWRPEDLQNKSGLFSMLNTAPNASARGPVLQSQHWMSSPWRRLTLVHAIQQPLNVPEIVKSNNMDITTIRNYDDTTAALRFQLNTHAPSTEKVSLVAKWNEFVDDLAEVKPNILPTSAEVASLPIEYRQNVKIFGAGGGTDKGIRPVIHAFQDTKHRKVRYAPIATTRYREYFTLLAQNNPKFVLSNNGSPSLEINILSTARPAPPLIEYVIPSFNWLKSSSPGKQETHMRTANVQVYMKRPWFSSGEGEMLGVVLCPNGNDGYAPYTTLWGQDPIYVAAGLNKSQFPTPDKATFPLAVEYEKSLLLPDTNGAKVAVAVYAPLYDEDRQLYYCNVPIATGAAYFPFIRLALARYQKNSLRTEGKDCCISGVVHADWVQLPAPRTVVLNYSGGPAAKNNIAIGVVGPIPVAISLPQISTGNKTPMIRSKIRIWVENPMIPKTEEAFIQIPRDRGNIWNKEFDIDQNFIKDGQMNFATAIELPDEYKSKPYRVVIEEYELIPRDHLRTPTFANETPAVSWGERLVFMDVFEVNGVV